MESTIGLTADERRATLKLALQDDPNLDWDGPIAYFLGEAIGKLTKQGRWNKTWKSYGLYSSLNKIATFEITGWDPDNIQGKLEHIHQREFQDLIKIKDEWITRIRKDPDNSGLRQDAIEDIEQRKAQLKALNTERALFKKLAPIQESLQELALRDAAYAKGLKDIQAAILATRTAPILHQLDLHNRLDLQNKIALENLDAKMQRELKALTQSKAAPILANLAKLQRADHDAEMHRQQTAYKIREAQKEAEENKDAKRFSLILAEHLEEITELGRKLSFIRSMATAKEDLDNLIPHQILPHHRLNPWMIIPPNITGWEAHLIDYKYYLKEIFGRLIAIEISEAAKGLTKAGYKSDAPWSYYRSKASFMAAAANTLLLNK